ncbi:MAG: alpha/beta hydrolase [Spongiibacteraceae bacterium]|jgi:acetyl esterase/lipase|nr:alpha/beta hydrolase [Spongiibacteraceae bacterium]
MSSDTLHPELREIFRKPPPLPLHNGLGRAAIRLMMRLIPADKPLPGVTLEDHRLDTCRVRVYRPESGATGAGLLWIHGGGYLIGNLAMNDYDCSLFARKMGMVVVSVDYRLSPRHRFPAPLDDCNAAWHWLVREAPKLGVDTGRLVISGESAGGGLAAALVQRVHDAGGVQPAAQALFCPMLDDRTAANRALDAENHLLWNNRLNRTGWTCYLGREPGAADLPPYAAAARRKDLAGLPPTWMGVGDIDLFLEENRLYAERLRAAGVECQFTVVPGAPHGFECIARNAQVSIDYFENCFAFLRRALDQQTQAPPRASKISEG